MTAPKEVKVGQVWKDNDKRCQGRTIRVEKIEHDSRHSVDGPVAFAVCITLTESHERAARAGSPNYRSTVGRVVRLRVDRMRPTATGWKLIKQVGD